MNTKTTITIVGGLLACLALASPAEAEIRYVKAGATGSGASWSDPSGDLRAAMNASQEFDQVWVAAGTYTPGNDPADYFPLPNRVDVIGGFYGDPQDPTGRDPDPVTNGTVLSGDIGVPGLVDDNCYCVVVSNVTETVLDGFTITGGYGGYWIDSGAGIYVAGGSPTLANLRVIGNQAPLAGGGVYMEDGAPNFTACRFESNRAGVGAALYLENSFAQLPITVDRCTFVSNTADSRAAALFNSCPENVRVWNTIFVANRCLGEAPGGTTAHVDPSNIQYVNCLFNGNTGFKNAAAMWNGSGSNVSLVNCTVSSNTSVCGICGGVQTEGTTTVANCLFWGNTDSGGSDETPQLYRPGGTLDVNYSSVQDWSGQYGGTQNNGNDPSFVDPDGADAIPGTPDDNLRLLSTSLCLDNGDNQAISGFSLDLDGTDRVVNVTVDRGAYEYHLVDCNNNQEPDGSDIANCDGSPWCSDCNGNGVLDECDLPPTGSHSSDCNSNDIPDECDIDSGLSRDCDLDGVPDECVLGEDCNENCRNDAEDIACGEGNICDGIPGSCDANENLVPDDCEFGSRRAWTTDDEFDEGTLINVNHSTADQLQRNDVATTRPLPYVWIAVSDRGTIVKIDTNRPPLDPPEDPDAVLGEYLTAPQGFITDECMYQEYNGDPSRTTVDLDGSVWTANRAKPGDGLGSVVKVGLVIGGTRVNADGAANADGHYLEPPFDYCACEDRDGDGLIKTSRGLGDILPWDNWDGRDEDGGVENAEDECILRYVRVSGTGTRTVAIDRENNVWVGGDTNKFHERIDGFSGALQLGPIEMDCGGYGGLVAYAYDDVQQTFDEVLWSARKGHQLLRYDVTHSSSVCDGTHGDYGLGFDPRTSRIWHSSSSGELLVYEIDAALNVTEYSYSQLFASGPGLAKGVAVDSQGDVWIAESDGDEVLRLGAPDPWAEDLPHTRTGTVAGFNGTTGVAVDDAGKIWVSEINGARVSRIDPTRGVAGEIDLRVPLGDDALPYNYGDMTGMVVLHATGVGTWSAVHDGLLLGTEWCRIVWNTETCDSGPDDDRLTVEARAADNEAWLAAVPYTQALYSGGVYQSLEDVVGRFVQIRVRFQGTHPHPDVAFATPDLCDLAVYPVMECLKGDMNHDQKVDGRDIQRFVYVLVYMPPLCSPDICVADNNCDGLVDIDDVPGFVQVLLEGPACTEPCGSSGARSGSGGDCNSNGVYDANDIANGTSEDCNHNYVPDECDIDPADPDGDGEVSGDLNTNGIPDECEPDCNGNGTPDDKDIADATSTDVNTNGVPDECEPDCNTNGVPDEWDVSQGTSEDCNTNGTPDECEFDCNTNGVPDDCDIDPSDPDGDGEVSADCQPNAIPDECDLSRSFAPSFDCNNNAVPDDCELAGNDCNSNGLLDECDIAYGISQDVNQNGIPDECEGGGGEGGSAPMGGGSPGGGGFPLPEPIGGGVFEAWLEFYEWFEVQTWGPEAGTSGSEQFAMVMDKLAELGLPLANPWMASPGPSPTPFPMP